MYKVCSSRITASDFPYQPLNARKSNALSLTAPSQSASHSTKTYFFDFPTMFYGRKFISQYSYSKCLIYYLKGWHNLCCYEFFTFLVNFLLPNNSKTRHKFFDKFSSLLFIITNVP